MGSLDRALRTLVPLVVGGRYMAGAIGGPTVLVLGLAAVAFLLTSFLGTCPPSVPGGLSTRRKQGSEPFGTRPTVSPFPSCTFLPSCAFQ
jgi:hypothetical protein